MSLRDILVQVDETAGAHARITIAADLAQRCEAHLDGAFLAAEIPPEFLAGDESYATISPGLIDELTKAHEAALATAGETARGQFEAAAANAHVPSSWSVITAQDPAVLIAPARRADLLVIPNHVRPCRGRTRLGAAEFALASGGPVLVAPDSVAAHKVGRRVLVAWNGSREAARALRDAWAILPADAELHILVVSSNLDGAPDAGLQRHLEHHGRRANLIVDPGPDGSVGDIIERQAEAVSADLVVMGLYGRSRLQELILGGVSRHMLDRLPVPLLVSH